MQDRCGEEVLQWKSIKNVPKEKYYKHYKHYIREQNSHKRCKLTIKTAYPYTQSTKNDKMI